MKHERSERHMRIDKLLVDRGLAESRTKAQALVMAGVVLADEQRVNKPSDTVASDAHVRLKGGDDPTSRYVGRGGLKLETALRDFKLNVEGFTCLDVGASTGGFTDCLLQHGAKHVIAIDVGHGQMDAKIAVDPRVELREGVNARSIGPTDFDRLFDIVVADLSFISLTLIIPALSNVVAAEGDLVLLVKPQFEVGPSGLGKGGVVRDEGR